MEQLALFAIIHSLIIIRTQQGPPLRLVSQESPCQVRDVMQGVMETVWGSAVPCLGRATAMHQDASDCANRLGIPSEGM